MERKASNPTPKSTSKNKERSTTHLESLPTCAPRARPPRRKNPSHQALAHTHPVEALQNSTEAYRTLTSTIAQTPRAPPPSAAGPQHTHPHAHTLSAPRGTTSKICRNPHNNSPECKENQGGEKSVKIHSKSTSKIWGTQQTHPVPLPTRTPRARPPCSKKPKPPSPLSLTPSLLLSSLFSRLKPSEKKRWRGVFNEGGAAGVAWGVK